jgi:hypothetical protein
VAKVTAIQPGIDSYMPEGRVCQSSCCEGTAFDDKEPATREQDSAVSYTPKHAKPASANASSSHHRPFGIADTNAGRHIRKTRREGDLASPQTRRSVPDR